MHRGGLDEAMATAAVVEPTEAAVRAYLERYRTEGVDPPIGSIVVAPYGYDYRIGWDTHTVRVDGSWPCAWTDGPIKTG